VRIRIVRDLSRYKVGEEMDVPDAAAGQLVDLGYAEELPLVDVGGVGPAASTEILTTGADETDPRPPAR
jgi:hypothetical protein